MEGSDIVLLQVDLKTNKQANKQTSKQTNKQTKWMGIELAGHQLKRSKKKNLKHKISPLQLDERLKHERKKTQNRRYDHYFQLDESLPSIYSPVCLPEKGRDFTREMAWVYGQCCQHQSIVPSHRLTKLPINHWKPLYAVYMFYIVYPIASNQEPMRIDVKAMTLFQVLDALSTEVPTNSWKFRCSRCNI